MKGINASFDIPNTIFNKMKYIADQTGEQDLENVIWHCINLSNKVVKSLSNGGKVIVKDRNGNEVNLVLEDNLNGL